MTSIKRVNKAKKVTKRPSKIQGKNNGGRKKTLEKNSIQTKNGLRPKKGENLSKISISSIALTKYPERTLSTQKQN